MRVCAFKMDLLPREKTLSIGEFEHVCLYGTTNTGKTFTFKKLLCDGKFDFDYQELVFVGRGEQLEEIAACFAAINTKERGDTKGRMMKFFNFVDISTAIAYVESSDHSKLLFMDDIFIQGNKIKNLVAQFINQAKNSKTTCVLTIHEPFGGEPEKSVRNAANWLGMFNLNANTIARLTGSALTQDSPLMHEYLSRGKFEKVLFYNTLEHTIFDNNYLPLASIKNK